MMPTTPAASQKQAFPLAGTLNRLSFSELQTKHRNSPSLPAHRNLLIKLNCAEMEFANSLILAQTCRAEGGEIKHEKYSGSAVIQNGCNYENQQVKSKEKGSTENATLWGYGFYHHELNQYLAARQDLQLVRNYSQNPHMLNDSSNLRNDNANLRNYKNLHIAEQYARTYEILVGHRVTVSKPVQAFGSMPRLSSSRRSNLLIQPDLLSSPSSFIAAARRSDNSLSSLSCTTWRSLLSTVDIVNSCSLVCMRVDNVLHCMTCSKAKPRSARTLTGPLTTDVNASNEAAMLNHTPTRFKFLFLAVCRSDLNAKPHRESVTANSEQDARRSLAGQFVLSFAGRLPEVSHA